jgi:hypothetical protein
MNIDRFLPSSEEFLTKKYIEEMLESRMWVSHGSGFETFLEDSKYDEDFPKSLLGKTYDEMMSSDECIKYIKDFLPDRFNYVISELKETLNTFPLNVNRTVYLHENIRNDISEGKSPDIGKYWGVRETDSWDVAPGEEKGLSTNVEGLISPEDIDWIETIKSRMDYDNGDQEEEVQLKQGVLPVVTSMYCKDAKKEISLVDSRKIEQVFLANACYWLEKSVDCLEEINSGFCADFADSILSGHLAEDFSDELSSIAIIGFYDAEDLSDIRKINPITPSWTNWNKIGLMVEKKLIGHSFIKYNERYYDAESVGGVDNLFDLKIFQRSQNEFMNCRIKEKGIELEIII